MYTTISDLAPAMPIARPKPVASSTELCRKGAIPESGWLAVRCLGRSENPNLSPAFAFAHTSPFYVLVDGQPILLENGLPDMRVACIPREQITFTDGWHVMGLEGRRRRRFEFGSRSSPSQFVGASRLSWPSPQRSGDPHLESASIRGDGRPIR